MEGCSAGIGDGDEEEEEEEATAAAGFKEVNKEVNKEVWCEPGLFGSGPTSLGGVVTIGEDCPPFELGGEEDILPERFLCEGGDDSGEEGLENSGSDKAEELSLERLYRRCLGDFAVIVGDDRGLLNEASPSLEKISSLRSLASI